MWPGLNFSRSNQTPMTMSFPVGGRHINIVVNARVSFKDVGIKYMSPIYT
jgi:hypothetical protein